MTTEPGPAEPGRAGKHDDRDHRSGHAAADPKITIYGLSTRDADKKRVASPRES
jgi:hypothetical protein